MKYRTSNQPYAGEDGQFGAENDSEIPPAQPPPPPPRAGQAPPFPKCVSG
jgi:hypothetical protein